MKTKENAAPFVREDRALPVLREAIPRCQGCELYQNATEAVFGELESGDEAKKPKVAIMMIGEQPGDQEDKQGRPFVGPAGKLLDRCLEEAGIERQKVYVTNTVKHFKWEPRGKLRIHKKTEHERDQRLQAVAECGDGDRPSRTYRLPWCRGSTLATGV